MLYFTGNERVDAVLTDIYKLEFSQKADVQNFFEGRFSDEPDFDFSNVDEKTNRFYADKVMAIDAAKAEFCYGLVRAMRATRIVEAGTSYGASTLFLAAALSENLAADPELSGKIYCSEWEEEKASAAECYFSKAGVDQYIELRRGDILETLRDVEGPIDFMLLDIWEPAQTQIVKMLSDRLRVGAVIIADNSENRYSYREYFDYVENNGFSTMTLPFDGGLEFTVKL